MNLFEAIKSNLKDLSIEEAFDEIKDYANNEWYLSPYARNLLKNCLDDSDKESSIRKIVHAVNTDSGILGDTLYYLCTILKQCNISLTSEERDFEKYLDDFSESDDKISLQESDVDWKAVVDKIYKYINYEYNEIGSDDRYFLNNIIKSAVGTDKDTAKQLEKAKREEDKAKQAEKDRLAKQRADREAKGITSYSLRGKKRDVLNGLESNLGKDFYVKEPGIDGILTIRRNDSNTGIRAYLQNKNLPDDVFGLVFEPVISKKISPRMQPIYDLSVGDYKTEIGSLGEFTGKEFKLTDIPKLTDTIKKVLSTEEV